MRITKGHNVVGILVGTGKLLVTDDAKLLDHVKKLEGKGRLSVQETVNHMNAGGYTTRGAYQLVETPSDREREMQLFHNAAHHDMNISIELIKNSKPVEAKRDDVVIGDMVASQAKLEFEKEQLEKTVKVLEEAAAKLRSELEEATRPIPVAETVVDAAPEEKKRWKLW